MTDTPDLTRADLVDFEDLTAAALIVKDGNVRRANHVADELWGGSVVGQMVEDLMPAKRRVGHIERRTTWIAGNERTRNLRASEQLEILTLDGGVVPVKIGLSRLADDFVLVEVQDLTEILEKQQQFDRELAAIERRAEIESETQALQEQTNVVGWGIAALFGVMLLIATLGLVAILRATTIDDAVKDVAFVVVNGITAITAYAFGRRAPVQTTGSKSEK